MSQRLKKEEHPTHTEVPYVEGDTPKPRTSIEEGGTEDGTFGGVCTDT